MSGSIAKLNEEVFRAHPGIAHLLGYNLKHVGRGTMGEALAGAREIRLAGVERVGNRWCYVLEAAEFEYDPEREVAYDARVWVDPQSDFRPVRIEKLFALPGENRWKIPLWRVDDVELEEVNGAWFPVAGVLSHYVHDFEPPEGMSPDDMAALSLADRRRLGRASARFMSAPRHIRVQRASIRINAGIPTEVFQIEFPAGTRLWDDFLQKRFVVGEAAGTGEAGVSNADEADRSDRSRILIAGVLGMVVLGAVVIAARLRRGGSGKGSGI